MSKIFLYDFTKTFFFISIFFISYILFYNQVFNGYPSDLTFHIGYIDDIMNNKLSLPHPLFHYIVFFISKIFSIGMKISGVLVNSLLVTALAWIIFRIIKLYLIEPVNEYMIFLLVLIVIYSSSFFLPGLHITKYQYIGNGSIGIWHNVTLFMVKPFAFLSYFLFFYGIKIEKSKYFLLGSLIFSVISIVAKPSYIIMYLPMLFGVLIYAYYAKYHFKKVFSYFAILLFFTVFLLAYQYFMTYSHNDKSGIVIALFKVWHIYSDNIFYSIVMGNLFAVIFIVTAYKEISLESKFALFLLGIGIVLFAVFAESGGRFADANFSWSYTIAMQILFLSLLIDFINKYMYLGTIKRNFILIALVFQFIDGLYYFSKIFQGGGYL